MCIGGQAASNGTTNAGKKEYTITYNFVTPKIKTETVKYSPSSGTTVILPKNKDGYQWVLLVYGKDCRATGAASPFTAENKIFYGGDSDEEADRTILLKDVYGDLTFQEVAATCKLNNMGDNSQLINLRELAKVINKHGLHVKIDGAADSETAAGTSAAGTSGAGAAETSGAGFSWASKSIISRRALARLAFAAKSGVL